MFWRRKKRREENTQLAKLTIEEAQKITKLCEELKIGVWHNSTYFSYYTSENLTNSIISAAICRVEELKNILKNYD